MAIELVVNGPLDIFLAGSRVHDGHACSFDR